VVHAFVMLRVQLKGLFQIGNRAVIVFQPVVALSNFKVERIGWLNIDTFFVCGYGLFVLLVVIVGSSQLEEMIC